MGNSRFNFTKYGPGGLSGMKGFSMQDMAAKIGERILAFGPKGILGLLLFAAFWVAGVIGAGIMRRAGIRMNQERRAILNLAASTTKGSLVLFGAVTALGTMGVNVSALVAGLGLTGFALGFALRDALSNLLAGALIVIYRPFQISDKISVSGAEGVVMEINLRYTVLKGDGQTFLVPNSVLFTNTISLQDKIT